MLFIILFLEACNLYINQRREYYLHEDNKKKEEIQGQVKQIPNKFQVKGVHSLFLPLPFHEHVTDIKDIFYKC